VKGVYKLTRSFRCDALRISPCVAAANSSSLCAARSCTTNWNPPKAPSPCRVGGSVANTIAPETPNSCGRIRFKIAWAECSAPLLCECSFSQAEINTRLAAAPQKLKPETEEVSTPSSGPSLYWGTWLASQC